LAQFLLINLSLPLFSWRGPLQSKPRGVATDGAVGTDFSAAGNPARL